jgi:hypothetical protein
MLLAYRVLFNTWVFLRHKVLGYFMHAEACLFSPLLGRGLGMGHFKELWLGCYLRADSFSRFVFFVRPQDKAFIRLLFFHSSIKITKNPPPVIPLPAFADAHWRG